MMYLLVAFILGESLVLVAVSVKLLSLIGTAVIPPMKRLLVLDEDEGYSVKIEKILIP